MLFTKEEMLKMLASEITLLHKTTLKWSIPQKQYVGEEMVRLVQLYMEVSSANPANNGENWTSKFDEVEVGE